MAVGNIYDDAKRRLWRLADVVPNCNACSDWNFNSRHTIGILGGGWFIFWQASTVLMFSKHATVESTPEQTASIISSVTYGFLDPLVFLAHRTPHISFSGLPRLAKRDSAATLVRRSFSILDSQNKQKPQYLLRGLAVVFSKNSAFLPFSLWIYRLFRMWICCDDCSLPASGLGCTE
jgi:hypothetical protein